MKCHFVTPYKYKEVIRLCQLVNDTHAQVEPQETFLGELSIQIEPRASEI